ncbi:cyanoexosortase A system-associated protein [Aetokthonos hydrillicola Thurmond2011]|jgi:cyanoexosortase A|uniref:Cyanoexosortase A system-associated protein n=2 Tax=Aetokthonos TaxID=1550243 RepID=A0AAP5I3B3_9CYAN|nr:cyanoexosortase A system-associated protein [Aetokthonos hydrillicola CCALA 1050]MDR9894322.1 cyanoexosortase A system-associated protein [Aetokthonos hydrillicola Thurmond2011]
MTTLVVLHLSLVLNHPLQRNLLSDYILFWAGIILVLWKTKRQKDLDSNLLSNLFGLLLLIFIIARPLYLWNLDTALFLGGPLVAFAGLGLIVFGFRGLQRRWHFVLLLCLIFPTPSLTLEHLLPFTHLTTATSGFLLHYIGFKVTYQGDLLTLPTGQVSVGYLCTGGPLIIYLFKICFLSIITFSLNWLQKLGLALCAIGTGFAVGSVRIALLAVVVNNERIFHYWHDENGSEIFLAIAVTIFVILCNWLLPLEEFNSRKKQLQTTPVFGCLQKWRIPMLLVTWSTLVLGAVYLICAPSSIGVLADALPDKLAIKGWEQVWVDQVNTSFRKEIITVNDSDQALSSKRYIYHHNNQYINVQMRYIVNTYGNIENYLKKFTEITNVKDIGKNIHSKNGIGYYVLLNDSNQAYLTACINPRGGSTVTQDQFLSNRNSYDSTANRILPWLLGTAILKDNRCLWIQLSTALDGAGSESTYPILESVWDTNYTLWRSHFPKL